MVILNKVMREHLVEFGKKVWGNDYMSGKTLVFVRKIIRKIPRNKLINDTDSSQMKMLIS